LASISAKVMYDTFRRGGRVALLQQAVTSHGGDFSLLMPAIFLPRTAAPLLA
jgi:hypothetical protein